MARTHRLKRSDIRHELDKPTSSVILRYVGRALRFDDYLYGYPDGAFFAIQLSEVPWPDDLEELSDDLGIAIDPLPDAPRLRTAVADAIAAGALVDAPIYMDDLGVDRDVEWSDWEKRDLERKHRIAESRVAEIARYIANDMKLRASGIAKPSYEIPKVEQFMAPPPPVFAPSAPPVVVMEAEPKEVEVEVVEQDDVIEPASQTVVKAREAVKAARDAELPQRLPSGMRRRLRRMPPSAYVSYGEILEGRLDLCAAMTDARSLGRSDRESVVIDYDGEWPVVVRRYGKDGRTIYKVEDALRRYGISISQDAKVDS